MKTIIRGFITYIIFWGATSFATAQNTNCTIKGQVIENTHQDKLPYATISVETKDKKVIKRLACDGNGFFSVNLPADSTYIFNISSIGYTTARETVKIAAREKRKNLDKIILQEGNELAEAVVEAQKPLIKSDIDKITYNMDADPEAISSNLLDMLRKVPMITVDAEENVQLNGQSNYKILMNGKSSSMLSGKNLKDVLKGIPANTVKNIEVITNPSSKYEAEGVGGIINIITTRKELSGIVGSVGLYGDIRGGVSGNAYISSQINKFTISGNYYGGRYVSGSGDGYWSERENFLSDDFRYNRTDSKSKYNGYNNYLALEASYELDSLNLFSFSTNGYIGNYTNNITQFTTEKNKDYETSREFRNILESENGYGSVSANLDYQHTFNKKDKTLTASYKIDYNPRNSKNNNNIENILNYTPYLQHSKNDASGTEHTLQIDYYDPITEMHQVEGGAKYIIRKNISNSDILLWENDSWLSRPDKINDLDYTQNILGIYGGYVFKYKKTGAKAGFRMEATWNSGVSKRGEERLSDFGNDLFNVIPYVSFSWKLTETQNLKVSYTQRLQRPGIWYLNPYVDDSDPMNISYGNPGLKSEIIHSPSIEYSLFSGKINLNTSWNSQFRNNGIERITYINAQGVKSSTYENIGKRQDHKLNVYISGSFIPKITLYSNLSGGYTDIVSTGENKLHNYGFTYNGFIGVRWTAWKGGSISGSFGFGSPWIMLQGKSGSYYYSSFGVSQNLLKDKLRINLYVNDPFCKFKKTTSRYEDETFNQKTVYRQRRQQISLGLSYSFGKMNVAVKKARRGIKNDDVTGGGQKSGGEGK